MSTLHELCRIGDITSVKKIANYKNVNEKDPDDYGHTPLILACIFGHIEIVKLLIGVNGFNSLNKTNYLDESSFMMACLYGHTNIVKLLINIEGFDGLNKKNYCYNTPFYLACNNNRFETVKFLFTVDDVNIPSYKIYRAYFSDEMTSLIKSYNKFPLKTIAKIKLEQNIDVFRHIIFIQDGYFNIINMNNIST